MTLPHPTLKPAGSDYEREHPLPSRAGCNPAFCPERKTSRIALKYRLEQCNVLRSLWSQTGQAHYHTLTECVSTKLRESHRLRTRMPTPYGWTRIGTRGQVLIRPFVVASQAIERHRRTMNGFPRRQANVAQPARQCQTEPSWPVGAEKSFDTRRHDRLWRATYRDYAFPSRPAREVQCRPVRATDRHPDLAQRTSQTLTVFVATKTHSKRLFPSMYQRAIEEAVRLHRKDEHADKRWAARIN